jgi:ubiquinone/menaquinone biosynthesis C-methylase UbiE
MEPRAALDSSGCHTEIMPREDREWAAELALATDTDRNLPSAMDGINLVLNRSRLATFLQRFARDRDVRDLLTLDILGTAAGLPLSSTGMPQGTPNLVSRPFRLWEYVWLYKVLKLSRGKLKVLDLGGPASQLSVLAAIAGCDVTSVDINPEFVEAGKECARVLDLRSFTPLVGDMRDLSGFPAESFDIVVSCSVLEHLARHDQAIALQQIGRVLKPAGLVGLTFDFGLPAPGANEHLQPPHEPPTSAAEAVQRYSQEGLVPAGNTFSEDPIPGSLFHHEKIRYTLASLFLSKQQARDLQLPRCQVTGTVLGRLVVHDLPYKVHKRVGPPNALIETLKSAAAELERIATERLTELNWKQATINRLAEEAEHRRVELEQAAAGIRDRDREIYARENRIANLEATAAERLTAMEAHYREIQGREVRIAQLEATAAERLAAMEARGREIHDRELRIAKLEATAAERLTAMQDRDRVIQDMGRRAEVLETAADERLKAMLARDQVIDKLQSELEPLRAKLAEPATTTGKK